MILQLNLLLIEDDVYCKDFTLHQLNLIRDINFKKITWCKSFRTALNHISTDGYDIALIDLKIGQRDSGLKLVHACKLNGIIPIVLSGLKDKELESLRLGAIAFGDKSNDSYVISTFEKARPYIVQSSCNKIFKNNFITNNENIKMDVYKYISNSLGNNRTSHLLIGGEGSKTLSESLAFLIAFGEPNLSYIKSKDYKIIKIFDSSNLSLDEIKKITSTSKKSSIFYISNDYKKISKYFQNIISIPDINSRKNDIPLLLNYFAKCYLSFSDEALNALLQYQWKSISDLKYLCDHYLQEKRNSIIKLNDLPDHLNVVFKEDSNKNFITKIHTEFSKRHGLKKTVSLFRQQIVLKSFKDNNCNLSKTSRALDLTPAGVKKILDKNEEDL